ncbi:glycosyltransferase [bacterium]|nr:glycosyltransferase [bacterium]
MNHKDCAAVYVATGEKFVQEAKQSAESLRRQMPNLKIILHSDRMVESSLFDQVIKVDQPHYSVIDKTNCYSEVSENRLLFLDTDTFVAEPVFEIFDLLNRFELAVSHAPWRISWDRKTKRKWGIEGIPEAFSEPNTGVIGFQNTPKVQLAFRRWQELYEMHRQQGSVMHDQPAFRQTIWESDLSFYMLPPEYNCRIVFPTFINGTVKILHARFDDLDRIAERINAENGN